MAEYKVVERFISINGEGSKAGELTSFIRFQGCNMSCSYCDTEWANRDDAEYEVQNERDITEWVVNTGIKNVTITGGEPLLQKDIDILLKELMNKGLKIEIETNGSVDIENIINLGDDGPSLTLDYKLPDSGMESFMNMDNYKLIRKSDTVKFVIGSERDLKRATKIIDEYDIVGRCNIYFSPVFGSIEASDIVEFMIKNRLNGIKLQLQMHKYIWDSDMRGV